MYSCLLPAQLGEHAARSHGHRTADCRTAPWSRRASTAYGAGDSRLTRHAVDHRIRLLPRPPCGPAGPSATAVRRNGRRAAHGLAALARLPRQN